MTNPPPPGQPYGRQPEPYGYGYGHAYDYGYGYGYGASGPPPGQLPPKKRNTGRWAGLSGALVAVVAFVITGFVAPGFLLGDDDSGDLAGTAGPFFPVSSTTPPSSPRPTATEVTEVTGTIEGAGASSQQAAQEVWQAGFQQQHPDATISYRPIGSGGGREQFVSGGAEFAGSDTYLHEDALREAQGRCGEVVEIPVFVSPIVVIFNLEGVDQLNLKPATLAKIFDQKITKWNDPAIAADNPGANLPNTAITPVARSDSSGTTKTFTEYLAATAEPDWPHGVSTDWPGNGGEAASGPDGVVQAVTNGNGTIGYADADRAGDLGTAGLGVGDEFVEYSPEAAAKILEVSERVEGRGDHSVALDVAHDTTETGTYPLVMVSYALACTNYDDADTANLVRSYFQYLISEEGQRLAAESAGSAPISDGLREQLEPAVAAISG